MLAPDGRVVMISGANRGIGLAAANLLAGRGYRLSLGARDPAALESATAHLAADRIHRFTWDAKDAALSQARADSTVERYGRIDAVLANAGISLSGSTWVELALGWSTHNRASDRRGGADAGFGANTRRKSAPQGASA